MQAVGSVVSSSSVSVGESGRSSPNSSPRQRVPARASALSAFFPPDIRSGSPTSPLPHRDTLVSVGYGSLEHAAVGLRAPQASPPLGSVVAWPIIEGGRPQMAWALGRSLIAPLLFVGTNLALSMRIPEGEESIYRPAADAQAARIVGALAMAAALALEGATTWPTLRRSGFQPGLRARPLGGKGLTLNALGEGGVDATFPRLRVPARPQARARQVAALASLGLTAAMPPSVFYALVGEAKAEVVGRSVGRLLFALAAAGLQLSSYEQLAAEGLGRRRRPLQNYVSSNAILVGALTWVWGASLLDWLPLDRLLPLGGALLVLYPLGFVERTLRLSGRPSLELEAANYDRTSPVPTPRTSEPLVGLATSRAFRDSQATTVTTFDFTVRPPPAAEDRLAWAAERPALAGPGSGPS